MKILHVITSLEVGGAQRLLVDLLPLLATTEKISLLVYKRVDNDFEKTIEQASINILCLEEQNFYNPRIIFRMRKLFKNYDIVHAHLFPTIYWASLAAFGIKIKLVYTEHSTFNSRRGKWFLKPIEQLIYSRYNKIISISQQTQDALISWLGKHDKRFTVVNNGIDTKRFSSRREVVIPNSLIMISRFVASKDQETVIKAMQYITPNASLRFVGDGENRTHCEKIAKELSLTNRIHFLGSRSDIAELIASSYIGIQSSNWEGFGLTAVEIMACGKPVIGTNVDGLKQVISGAGLLFSTGNAKELAEHINALLNNSNYYELIANRCKKRANMFDIKIMAEKYMRVYKQIFTL